MPGGGGGGGGGGGSYKDPESSPSWTKALENLSNGNDLMHRVLMGQLSSDCQANLDALRQELGITSLGIIAMANSTSWNNPKGDSTLAIGLFVPGSSDYIGMREHAARQTISQYVSGTNGIVAASALPGSALWGNIYFSASFVSKLSTSDAAALLMHELLHTLGSTDPQIQKALFGKDSWEVGENSVNISNRLAKDCFK